MRCAERRARCGVRPRRAPLTAAQIEVLTSAGLTPAQIAALSPRRPQVAAENVLPAADLTALTKADNVITPQFTGDEILKRCSAPVGEVRRHPLRRRKGELLLDVPAGSRQRHHRQHLHRHLQQISHNVVGTVEGSDQNSRTRCALRRAPRSHRLQPDGGGARRRRRAAARGTAAVDALVAAGKIPQNPRSIGSAGRGAANGWPCGAHLVAARARVGGRSGAGESGAVRRSRLHQ